MIDPNRIEDHDGNLFTHDDSRSITPWRKHPGGDESGPSIVPNAGARLILDAVRSARENIINTLGNPPEPEKEVGFSGDERYGEVL